LKSIIAPITEPRKAQIAWDDVRIWKRAPGRVPRACVRSHGVGSPIAVTVVVHRLP